MKVVEIEVKFGIEQLPVYKTGGAAAADIHSNEDVIIPARGFKVVSTGLFMAIPKGYCVRVLSRSGLAFKNGIFVLNADGTIDSDYRDEVKIILANFSDEDFKVKKGDRIAQLKVEEVISMDFLLTSKLSDADSNRTGGFGSTGV